MAKKPVLEPHIRDMFVELYLTSPYITQEEIGRVVGVTGAAVSMWVRDYLNSKGVKLPKDSRRINARGRVPIPI